MTGFKSVLQKGHDSTNRNGEGASKFTAIENERIAEYRKEGGGRAHCLTRLIAGLTCRQLDCLRTEIIVEMHISASCAVLHASPRSS